MKFWKFMAMFTCLMINCISCCVKNKQCFWVIDAVEKDNLLKVASKIVPNGQYFLRIRIKRNEMINSEMLRSLVLTGVNPLINIESEIFGISHHDKRRFSILISSVLIEMGDQNDCGCILRNKTSGRNRENKCFCNGMKPTCSQAAQMVQEGVKCCQIETNCSGFTGLCNPAWLAPLYIPEGATALHCEVVDSGIGPYINSRRFTLHLDGFQLSINNTLHNRLGEEVTQLPSFSQQTPIHCLPYLAPVCVIGSHQMANNIIYTNSEFERMQFLKIQFESAEKNSCASKQHLSSVEVKGALSLPDRILLNTGAGIAEVQADQRIVSSSAESNGYTLVLSACVSHVVGPTQPSAHSVTVLGFGEEQDQEKIFVASAEQGRSSEFKEQRDSNGLNVCHFLRSQLQNTDSYPCQVISGSISSVIADSLVVLVKLKNPSNTDTFHLVRFEGSSNSGLWRLLFHFPTAHDLTETDQDNWQKIESKFSSQDSQASSLALSGLSFTAVVCKKLFLWGNALLYSPDGGISIHWLTLFPHGNATIVVFTSSPFDGTFAFLTDNQEVWIGQSGSANVQRLKSSLGPTGFSPGLQDQNDAFTVSIFFDSSGRLQQMIAEEDSSSETKCISREELPVGRIISRQVFSQKREENIKAFQKAKRNATSCISGQPSTHSQNVPRACPFARINFEAGHDVLYTRKCFYKLEPSVQLGSGLVQKTNTLHEYFTWVYTKVNSECSGISKDARQDTRDFLPELIYLGRSEWYSFVFYLYLDYDFQVETSAHDWSLIHLQTSFHVSDATILNVTSTRTEVIAKKAVKYEVTVQDSGLRLPQYRSGEELTPASLHIQVWNSGLSCTTSYGSKSALQNGQSAYLCTRTEDLFSNFWARLFESRSTLIRDERLIKGSYVLTVLLGCPAGLKLVFDPEASKNATGKEHFCSPVHDVPCFYFYRDFLPVFKLLDLATGQITQFLGKYGLKIVGGGPTYQSIADYTEEEQIKYNYQTTSSMASLIWASNLKTLGDIPVFSSTKNGFSWLCGTQSPCANVGANFPDNAEYYFKLEFSNRVVDADSSNCDFTFRFLIRVHGLPPGSFNPSSVIVLSCIGILATLILTLFALKRQEAKLWSQLKGVFAEGMYGTCRAKMYNFRKNKVENTPAIEVQLETVGRDKTINEGSQGGVDVSVDIRGNDTTARQHSVTNV